MVEAVGRQLGASPFVSPEHADLFAALGAPIAEFKVSKLALMQLVL